MFLSLKRTCSWLSRSKISCYRRWRQLLLPALHDFGLANRVSDSEADRNLDIFLTPADAALPEGEHDWSSLLGNINRILVEVNPSGAAEA